MSDVLVSFLKEQENAPLAAGDMSMMRHSSPEGGTDTVGYGHKLTPEEERSGTVYGIDIATMVGERQPASGRRNHHLDWTSDVCSQRLDRVSTPTVDLQSLLAALGCGIHRISRWRTPSRAPSWVTAPSQCAMQKGRPRISRAISLPFG